MSTRGNCEVTMTKWNIWCPCCVFLVVLVASSMQTGSKNGLAPSGIVENSKRPTGFPYPFCHWITAGLSARLKADCEPRFGQQQNLTRLGCKG